MKRKIQLSILILSLMITSCSRQKPMYGKEFNQERIVANIPIIPDNWEASGGNSLKSMKWYNPDLDNLLETHTPFHASKYIEFEYGALKMEEDIYYGSEDVRWDDSTLRENISITVFYEGIVSGFDHVELKREIFITNNSSFMGEISLEEAEEILESWGIDYP